MKKNKKAIYRKQQKHSLQVKQTNPKNIPSISNDIDLITAVKAATKALRWTALNEYDENTGEQKGS